MSLHTWVPLTVFHTFRNVEYEDRGSVVDGTSSMVHCFIRLSESGKSSVGDSDRWGQDRVTQMFTSSIHRPNLQDVSDSYEIDDSDNLQVRRSLFLIVSREK